MDLKNIQISDIKEKLQSIDKKTLIKFGIGFGSIILFLIIYYSILNPMVKKREAKYQDKIFNVGSICIGKYSPMALSDYAVGTNHVLPTNSSAKFSSGLSLSEFYKKISLIKLSKKGVEKIGEYATHLAEYEQLKGHALSIKSRINKE